MTAPSRRSRLRAIKQTRNLTAAEIGALVNREPSTVRQYLCGALATPPELVELLEFKLGMLRAWEDVAADTGQDSCACGDEKIARGKR